MSWGDASAIFFQTVSEAVISLKVDCRPNTFVANQSGRIWIFIGFKYRHIGRIYIDTEKRPALSINC